MKFTKICKCCGKEFETNSPQKLYCNREHWLPCPICGKLVKKPDRDFTRPTRCCSNECTHKLRMKSLPKHTCILCGKEFIPKSGVGLICPNTHYRKCAVCGKEFVVDLHNKDTMTCSDECQWKKARQTCIEKYGVDHPMKSEIGQKNFHAAMEKKYGHKHALQVERLREKAMNTNIEQYGSPYFCITQECIDKQTEKSGIISKTNLHFAEYLDNANIPYKMERRIEAKSFDFELLEKNIVIEINPSFTHSIIDTRYGGVDKNYHLEKSKLANLYGYRCIHVWQWDNWHRIMSLISDKKHIYARNCKLFKIYPKIANQFLDDNHLQGACRGQLICFGLLYDNELVEVMTFGKPRYDKKYDVELLRLCTRSDIQVIGGASKLFKFAMQYIDPESVISYCDISKFNGEVYDKIGMKLVRQTPPQEIWSKGKDYITANLLRQKGYDQLFKANYGKGTSNEQLMLDHGWLPVYDCGQAVYEWRK